jgi:hypothetical protein
MENCHAFDDFSPQGLLGSSSDINFSYKEQQFNLNLLSDDGLLLIIHRQQRTEWESQSAANTYQKDWPGQRNWYKIKGHSGGDEEWLMMMTTSRRRRHHHCCCWILYSGEEK